MFFGVCGVWLFLTPPTTIELFYKNYPIYNLSYIFFPYMQFDFFPPQSYGNLAVIFVSFFKHGRTYFNTNLNKWKTCPEKGVVLDNGVCFH